jgi:hypothetical protein
MDACLLCASTSLDSYGPSLAQVWIEKQWTVTRLRVYTFASSMPYKSAYTPRQNSHKTHIPYRSSYNRPGYRPMRWPPAGSRRRCWCWS